MSDRRSSAQTDEKVSCPVCGKVSLRWLFEKKGRQFWACQKCGLEKQVPLPTLQELQAYYDSQFDSGMYQTFTSAEQMKTMTAKQRLKEITPVIKPQGRWLDVGCANGVFVREAAASGAKAEGVELSSVAVAQAVEAGLPVRCGGLEDVEDTASFDCITAFDVLEHVLDPLTFMQDIAKRLKPGGYAALTMPDKSSIFAKLMGSRWWFYIPEEHLHYFDHAIIRQLMIKVGLEPVVVARTFKPLTYDYGLTQFIEFNPLIYRVMKLASAIIPKKLRQWIVPLFIGEMKVIARKPLA
ncbi:MAG: class I SAM-dependent methyltransferase [Prosthecobacter sp.]|uniref:class I SAM-dependent methyltransferase n=1 Tax=Prosthecobacter sp. TaxID=1965333 RepID=UPI0039027272